MCERVCDCVAMNTLSGIMHFFQYIEISTFPITFVTHLCTKFWNDASVPLIGKEEAKSTANTYAPLYGVDTESCWEYWILSELIGTFFFSIFIWANRTVSHQWISISVNKFHLQFAIPHEITAWSFEYILMLYVKWVPRRELSYRTVDGRSMEVCNAIFAHFFTTAPATWIHH